MLNALVSRIFGEIDYLKRTKCEMNLTCFWILGFTAVLELLGFARHLSAFFYFLI